MKLVLVTYLCGESGLMPVGLLMLAEIARREGWQVQVRDLPPVHGEELFLTEIDRCDVVGFSTLSSTFHRSLRLARAMKARYPEVTVVMGGPQATATAREVLTLYDAVDMVFLGEAEVGWQAFVQGKPLSDVPGLIYRQGGTVTETHAAPLLMDLDALPMPAFDLYQSASPGLSVPLESGRGCPFRCTYCSTNQYFSRRFRTKGVARILAEMDRLNDLHHAWSFSLIHDNFITDRKMVRAFCEAMAAHPRRYTWNISARPDKLDPELVALLKGAGCKGVFLGLESGSEAIQKQVRKNLNLGRAVDNIAHVRQAGLATMVSFIIGFPQETVADLRDTLTLYTRLAADRCHHLQLHLLSPLSGSHMLTVEHHPLAFDGMPTDFNETGDPWQEGELAMIQRHPRLFPHMFHFVGVEVPRARLLFIAHLLRLGRLYFNNFTELVGFWHGHAWVDFLLTTPIPAGMGADWNGQRHHGEGIEWGYGVLEDLARHVIHEGLVWRDVLAFDRACARVTMLADEPPAVVFLPRAFPGGAVTTIPGEWVTAWQDLVTWQVARSSHGFVEVTSVLSDADMVTLIRELCSPCGECCLVMPLLHLGFDQDQEIGDFLEQYLKGMEEVPGLFRQGVALPGGTRVMVRAGEGEPTLQEATQAQGAAPTACPHLLCQDHALVCAIQGSKPHDCLAFPMALTPAPGASSGWNVLDDHRSFAWRHHCALARELTSQPTLRQQYQAWVVQQVVRSGQPAGGWDAVEEEDGVV